MKKCTLNQNREWTPEVAIPVEGATGNKGDQINKRGKPSDQLAIKLELRFDIVVPSQSGNEPRIELNTMRYIHDKDWDAKLLKALISVRMKPSIIKISPECK